MLWFIICPIITPILGFHWDRQEGYRLEKILIIPYILVGLVVAIVANFLCMFPVLSFCEDEYRTVDTTEIYALNDNVGVQGKFFLGSGQVNSEPYYYYIEETDAGKHIGSISAKNAYICESNTETPRIEMQRAFWKKYWIKWLFCINASDTRYMIYIPENSVTTDFNVDLSNGSLTTPSTSPSGENSYCSNCGRELSPSDKFCSGCGNKIEVS